jgi:hypothetical protein
MAQTELRPTNTPILAAVPGRVTDTLPSRTKFEGDPQNGFPPTGHPLASTSQIADKRSKDANFRLHDGEFLRLTVENDTFLDQNAAVRP